MVDIKRSNKICRHKALDKASTSYKVNDMPSGWMNESELNMRIYYVWKAMIERTTEKYWGKYPTYICTTVDESWRYLSNFVNDIIELEGYTIWANSPNQRMMLDKDTLVNGNKHYSKETCRFITHTESNQDVSRRHPEITQKARQVYADEHSMPVVLINSKTGESIEYPSIKATSRSTGLNYEQIRKAFHSEDPDKRIVKDWVVMNPV